MRSRVAGLKILEARDALRSALGAPAPVPPYHPPPPDANWSSGAFTAAELKKAAKAHRRKFWADVKKWDRRSPS